MNYLKFFDDLPDPNWAIWKSINTLSFNKSSCKLAKIWPWPLVIIIIYFTQKQFKNECIVFLYFSKWSRLKLKELFWIIQYIIGNRLYNFTFFQIKNVAKSLGPNQHVFSVQSQEEDVKNFLVLSFKCTYMY